MSRPVVDRTGLPGSYGIKLDFSLRDGDDRPIVFTAVQEQLGLKLEHGRAPIVTVVTIVIATTSVSISAGRGGGGIGAVSYRLPAVALFPFVLAFVLGF